MGYSEEQYLYQLLGFISSNLQLRIKLPVSLKRKEPSSWAANQNKTDFSDVRIRPLREKYGSVCSGTEHRTTDVVMEEKQRCSDVHKLRVVK